MQYSIAPTQQQTIQSDLHRMIQKGIQKGTEGAYQAGGDKGQVVHGFLHGDRFHARPCIVGRLSLHVLVHVAKKQSKTPIHV